MMVSDRYKHKESEDIFIVLDHNSEYVWLGPKISTVGSFKITYKELEDDYELNSSYNPSPYKRVDIK